MNVDWRQLLARVRFSYGSDSASTVPRVSVGLPLYNGAKHLPQALDSLLAQEFRDFELIISDNGSSDCSEEICRDYATRDRRIRYHREARNRGAAWNFNRVFRLARGEYFRWACHDDLCDPSHLGECVRELDASPHGVVMVYTRTAYIDGQGRHLGSRREQLDCRSSRPHRRLRRVLSHVRHANPLFGLIRSDALRKTRLLGPYQSADFVLFTELALIGELREVPRTLFFRRLHEGASRAANVTPAQVARWLDPDRRKRFHLPETKVLLEHMKSIRRADIPSMEKARAAGVVLSDWLPRRWGRLKAEYKDFLARASGRFRANGTGTRGEARDQEREPQGSQEVAAGSSSESPQDSRLSSHPATVWARRGPRRA